MTDRDKSAPVLTMQYNGNALLTDCALSLIRMLNGCNKKPDM